MLTEADLIIAFIEQVQAGEIALGDSSARYPYIYAFPVAMDAYNQATPPAGLDQDQKMVGLNLSSRALGPDYPNSEQQAVDRLLQEKYGDLQLPTRVP